MASPQTCLRGFQVCARVAPWPVDQARYGWYEHGGFAWCSPIPTGVTPSTGLRPASIFVYVYPLPPDAITGTAAGIALPVSAAGSPIPPTAGYFQTVFYPGTTGVTQAKTSTVAPGQSLPGENFAVRTPDVVEFAVSPQAGGGGGGPGEHRLPHPSGGNLWITPAYASTNRQCLEMLTLRWRQEKNYSFPVDFSQLRRH